jgi:hypothetical protein
MMRPSQYALILVGLLGATTIGCASNPVAPFNQMGKGNVTAFRLQNNEPPAPVTQANSTTANGQTQLVPGLPTEVNQLLQQGAATLQQLAPGLLPALQNQAAAATAAPVENVPRFYGFRILAQTQIMDSELRVKLADVFGEAKNYETPKTACLNPEYGFAFGPQGGATYDYVVSMTCHQVQSKNFPWPHQQTGMTVSMEKDLVEAVRRIWPS